MWKEFKEAFEGWTEDIFMVADRLVLKLLRNYLVVHGVWVKAQAGSNSFAKILNELLVEETQYVWTEEEIRKHIADYENVFLSNLNPLNVRQPETITPGTIPNVRTTIEGTPQLGEPSVLPSRQQSVLGSPRTNPVRPSLEPQAYRQYNPTPHPVFGTS